MNKFKFIDLFCGIGGFRIALESNEGECVFSSDIDYHVREAYYKNFKEYPAGDITKIHEKDIPDHDILCAGFPCQPFSIAGHRKGFKDTRGTLFFDIERIIRKKKPNVFILENVKGLVSHDQGNTLKTIISKLAKRVNGEKVENKSDDNLGYNVFYKVINSIDHGVPQNRERIYIVGFRKNVNFEFPKESKESKKLAEVLEKNVGNEYLISDIAKRNVNKHLKIKNLDSKKEETLLAYEIRPSKCSFRKDGFSPCLTAKMGTGGNNVPVLVSEMRKLTVKECLSIQGFPKKYNLEENKSKSYKMVGNSVSVPVIKKIISSILKTL
jgi:DNA (cytosine-5)-methyltransferase 1